MPAVYRANPPVCGEDPRVLILGTFPSPLSREKREYYGNPRNQFWRLIFGVFGVPFDNPEYGVKTALLTENRIALWDVITECEAEGALDSNLRNPVYNAALPGFVAARGIDKVFFNGNNAYTFYRRGIGAVEKNVLPSSSPAHAGMRFEEKLRRWREGLLSRDGALSTDAP
ncbi:MAG: DNA-deoxyinosine glycosylase [Oscillospiraceae bacterium]|jgi:TDG/mug DNA glycosylase family protein|nr:DNA-deoxyinosine glycosylase [Oscillospiraceae bacterium]